MTSCSADRLGNQTEDTSLIGITKNGWMCPNITNFTIYGSPHSLNRTYFRVRVVPCNLASTAGIAEDNVTCASDSEIQTAIRNHFI
jgi:hypothetical protein